MIEKLAKLVGMNIRFATTDFEATLRQYPLAQKRTSHNKAFVYVAVDTIFKGPYGSASMKLINNLRYPYLIHCVEDALSLPKEMRGTYIWDAIYVCSSNGESSYYVAGKNIGNTSSMKIEQASTQIDLAFDVVQRQTLLRRASEIEKIKVGSRYQSHPQFDPQVAKASLQHLYLRYLFNIGDSGTHNILVRDDRQQGGRPIAGIDFDEHRGARNADSIWSCFFRKDFAFLQEIYGGFVSAVQLIDSLDSRVENQIDAVNQTCESWSNSLPVDRRWEGVVSVSKILERAATVRSLMAIVNDQRP